MCENRCVHLCACIRRFLCDNNAKAAIRQHIGANVDELHLLTHLHPHTRPRPTCTQLADGTRYLHTGDFRFCEAMRSSPWLAVCSRNSSFPPFLQIPIPLHSTCILRPLEQETYLAISHARPQSNLPSCAGARMHRRKAANPHTITHTSHHTPPHTNTAEVEDTDGVPEHDVLRPQADHPGPERARGAGGRVCQGGAPRGREAEGGGWRCVLYVFSLCLPAIPLLCVCCFVVWMSISVCAYRSLPVCRSQTIPDQ